jgi:hypothetical protein
MLRGYAVLNTGMQCGGAGGAVCCVLHVLLGSVEWQQCTWCGVGGVGRARQMLLLWCRACCVASLGQRKEAARNDLGGEDVAIPCMTRKKKTISTACGHFVTCSRCLVSAPRSVGWVISYPMSIA